MKLPSRTLIVSAVVTGLSLPVSVYATNGMHAEGTGVKNRGMGGAGVALAQETAAIAINPAAVVGVGDRADVALGVFSPKSRGYELKGNLAGFDGKQESGSNTFLIPFGGYSKRIDDQSAWAITVTPLGGMNTDYSDNFGKGLGLTGSTGINLEQLFIAATYGRKVNANFSYGVSGIIAYQRFEVQGLQAFQGASSDPSNMTDNGVDSSSGFGIKLGAGGELGGGFNWGVSYQPEIDMSEFDKYKGLFADQGDFNIAPTYQLGVAWKKDHTTVAFDYQYIDYEAVGAIGNSTSVFPSKQFGDDDGPGFGWKSINVYKLGVQHQLNKAWTLRGGWNHGDSPIESDEVSVNFLAPGVIEDHLTLGATMVLSANSEISFDYVRSFNNSVTGDFADAFGGGEMTIEMEQNFLEMGYSMKF